MENIFCECHFLPVMISSFLFASLAECLMEWAMEKQWRRKSFIKYLNCEDIELINYHLSNTYLTSIHCQETAIGKIIVNAYNKDIELKKLRKEKWKKIWNKKNS